MQEPALFGPVTGEVLVGAVFSAQELAHACGMPPDWVLARVDAGVLQVDTGGGTWRFDGITLIRARRLAQLEATFDADLQLAALTVDLIEEVQRLKLQLGVLADSQTAPSPHRCAPQSGPEGTGP